MGRLRRLLDAKSLVRIMEAHNGLSSLLVECLRYSGETVSREFDSIWLGSLTDSMAKGRPDSDYIDRTSRANTVNDILEVTTKPVFYDGGTGGVVEHFTKLVRSLERLGVSAVAIADEEQLEGAPDREFESGNIGKSAEGTVNKIHAGKHAQVTDDFMIVPRVASLRVGGVSSVRHGVACATAYIAAGADGLIIDLWDDSGNELVQFMRQFLNSEETVPVFVSANQSVAIDEHKLQEMGVSAVIYANQLLGAAHKAMAKVGHDILVNEGAPGGGEVFDLESRLLPGIGSNGG